MRSIEEVRRQREAILACAHQHGATRVRVFGSVSRFTTTPDSDLDLLVAYAPGTSLTDHIALSQSLRALLKVPVDVVSEGGLSPLLREQVLQDAVDL